MIILNWREKSTLVYKFDKYRQNSIKKGFEKAPVIFAESPEIEDMSGRAGALLVLKLIGCEVVEVTLNQNDGSTFVTGAGG